MRRGRILDVRIITWKEDGGDEKHSDAIAFISYEPPYIGIGREEHSPKYYDSIEGIVEIISHEQVHWTLWHQIFVPDNIPRERQTLDKIAESIGL